MVIWSLPPMSSLTKAAYSLRMSISFRENRTPPAVRTDWGQYDQGDHQELFIAFELGAIAGRAEFA